MRILRRAKRNNDVYSLSYFKALMDAILCFVIKKPINFGMTKGGKNWNRKREIIF
jgi:hypothetical protein